MRKNIITLLLLAAGAVTYAQGPVIGMGVGTKKPQKSAILDVDAKDKGVLIPRVALLDVTKFQLVGGDAEGAKEAVKGMIVFNTNEIKDKMKVGFHYWDGAKWVQITSEKELETMVKELKTEIKTEISKITEIISGGKDDKSYLVSYNPDSKSLNYLKPKADGTGYDVLPVMLEDLVKGAETATFIKPIIVKKKVKDPKDPQKEVEIDAIESYIYFNEPAIIAWLAADKNNNTIDNIPNDKGVKIDIIEAVSNNFEKIVEKNTELITTVIKETDGNVRVEEVGGKLVLQYKPKGSDTYVNVDLSGVETVTKVGKMVADADGKAFVETANVAPPAVGKGVIYYAYEGEADATGKRTTSYIDLGKDVETLLKENTIVKEQFTKEIQTILNGDGGNVYFGKMDPTDPKAPEVLYRIDDKKEKHLIDISESVKEVFEKIIKEPGTNTEIIKLIKEATGDKLDKEGVAVETGDVILTKKVYKQVSSIVVADPDSFGYDSTFTGTIVIDKNVEFGKLLSVAVLGANGNILVNSVTDITVDGGKKSGDELKFYFGTGAAYTPILPGTYQVVFEFIEK